VSRRTATSALRLTRTETQAVLAVAAANVLLNRIVDRKTEVIASLAAAGGMLLLAQRAGVSLADLGLSPETASRGLRAGAIVGVPLGTLLALGALIPSTRHFFHDPRIVDAETGEAAYQFLARMPLATAAGEELIFRGALEGVLAVSRPRWQVRTWSAALFGLWHVLPALDRMHSNPGLVYVHEGSARRRAGVVGMTVAVTAGAGLFLSWLRDRTRSVLAPIVVHYAVNAAGYAGGWWTARLMVTPPPERRDAEAQRPAQGH